MYDIVIIGGGAAGITAAIYALRAGMNTILLEKRMRPAARAINIKLSF